MTCVIGTSAAATPGKSGANIALATLPCSRLTPLTRAAMRMPSAAMLKTPGSPVSLGSQRQQALEREAGRHPAAAEVARHEITREAVDAGGHRRVRREDGACAHDLQRMLGIDSVLDEAAHALHREEAGVALVHVEHGGLDATGRERLDTADAEQDLLAQPVLAVAAVQAVGDGALGRRIGVHVRVQQEQLDPPDVDAPEPGVQHGTGERHGDECLRAVRAEHGRHGQERRVEFDELLLLGASSRQQLAEIAVAVEEADADDRNAEVARRLEVVAGQDPQPARVLGQRLAEAELG